MSQRAYVEILSTREVSTKEALHEAQPLAARVFYISLVFSNVRRVVS